MKKILLLLSLVFAIATSCEKEKGPKESGVSKEVYINTYEKDDKGSYLKKWHYYSTEKGEVIGTGMLGEDDIAWAARTDWDFAIYRLNVKTNSGASSSKGAKGGLHTFDKSIGFADIKSLPAGISFIADLLVTEEQMQGAPDLIYSKSTAVVTILGPMSGDGPSYNKAPNYAFRSADGKKYYKVEFTQYQAENKESGHVKFNIAEIY